MNKRYLNKLLNKYIKDSQDRKKIKKALSYQFNFQNKIEEKNSKYTINNLLKGFVFVESPSEEKIYYFGARVDDNEYSPSIDDENKGTASKKGRFFTFVYHKGFLKKDEVYINDLCKTIDPKSTTHKIETDFNGFKKFAIQEDLQKLKDFGLKEAYKKYYEK